MLLLSVDRLQLQFNKLAVYFIFIVRYPVLVFFSVTFSITFLRKEQFLFFRIGGLGLLDGVEGTLVVKVLK